MTKTQGKEISILYDLFQKTEVERIFSNSFFEARIRLIPKLEKDITKKKDRKRKTIDQPLLTIDGKFYLTIDGKFYLLKH